MAFNTVDHWITEDHYPWHREVFITHRVRKEYIPVEVEPITKDTPAEDIEKRASMLPDPTGWRILVVPIKLEEQTDAGIYLPDDARSLEDTASMVSMVLKVGPLAYKDKRKFGDDGPWCKEGDFVITKSYQGTRFKALDQELRFINDDTVEGVVDDPRGITRA